MLSSREPMTTFQENQVGNSEENRIWLLLDTRNNQKARTQGEARRRRGCITEMVVFAGTKVNSTLT